MQMTTAASLVATDLCLRPAQLTGKIISHGDIVAVYVGCYIITDLLH